jgi:chemotaxis protein methyltransferase CheR
VTPQDFAYLTALIRERSGIVLTADKAYLVENRLKPLAAERGLKGLGDLVGQLRLTRDERLLRTVVELMTTNETLFFRDGKPFDLLRDVVLPQLVERRPPGRPIRIWSAACSAGQEPYSIAMTVKENAARFAAWPVEIVATDLSAAVLAKARTGTYSQFEVQRGLPIRLLMKYFRQVEAQWTIVPEIRAMVQFREQNMLQEVGGLGSFDIVFCRNVLIYFDRETKQQVLERIARVLGPAGTLFLGGTETVIGLTTRFEPVPEHRGLYRVAALTAADSRLPDGLPRAAGG